MAVVNKSQYFKHQIGKKGEDQAVQFLESENFTIIERNYQNNIGEIDIIAHQNDSLYFIEVKTRSGANYGSPSAIITTRKLQRMELLIHSWLRKHQRTRQPWQVIIIEVTNSKCRIVKPY